MRNIFLFLSGKLKKRKNGGIPDSGMAVSNPEAYISDKYVFNYSAYSDVGGRANNEDCVKAAAVNGLFCAAVADGLGAHSMGELASQLAVDTIFENCPHSADLSSDSLEEMFNAANDAILAGQDDKCDMKTTAVAMLSDGNRVFWASTGDSRLYQFRNGKIIAYTKDQSVSQLAVEMKKITRDGIRSHPDRNRLLHVLGAESTVVMNTSPGAVPVRDGDAYLLCTDGFWEYIEECEMERFLKASESAQMWLTNMCTLLKQRVRKNNDNNSAIVIKVSK